MNVTTYVLVFSHMIAIIFCLVKLKLKFRGLNLHFECAKRTTCVFYSVPSSLQSQVPLRNQAFVYGKTL